MKLKGYLLTSKKFEAVLDRVKELSDSYYKFRKFNPVYLITFYQDYDIYNKGDKAIFFTCNEDIELINLLGYGFEGLYDDDEKIKEIEEFGKYRCSVQYVDIDDTLVNIEKICD